MELILTPPVRTSTLRVSQTTSSGRSSLSISWKAMASTLGGFEA
jgi:hypothetical protein